MNIPKFCYSTPKNKVHVCDVGDEVVSKTLVYTRCNRAIWDPKFMELNKDSMKLIAFKRRCKKCFSMITR